MVFKRSEYRHQFKVSSLERNIPIYKENLHYRYSRRERECAHTPIAWEGELTESESDERSTGEEEIDKLPIAKIAIAEEETDEEDEVEKEKRKAQEKDVDTKQETCDKDDKVDIVTQDGDLRKSAKEKLNKYAWKENREEEVKAKSSEKKKVLHKTFVKPKKSVQKDFGKVPRPKRPDRQDKIPRARPTSAPALRGTCTARSEPFVAYGCGARDDTLGEKKTFNIRASSAVYPAALRAKKRNQMMIEKLQEKQRVASANEKRKRALFNEKMTRETIAWDTEYRRNYPAYSNTVYAVSGPDRSPRKQKSHFLT